MALAGHKQAKRSEARLVGGGCELNEPQLKRLLKANNVDLCAKHLDVVADVAADYGIPATEARGDPRRIGSVRDRPR